MKNIKFSENDKNRIIEMAWEDRTPFEAIYNQFKCKEKELILLMRNNLSNRSFKNWRARIRDRKTKHEKLRCFNLGRFHCPTQKKQKRNQ